MFGLVPQRFTLAFIGLCLVLAADAPAKEAIVTRADGTKIQGEIVEDGADGVTLLISNIRTPIKRADILEIEYVKSFAEQFKERRAEVADDDYAARYKLARWAHENDAYDIARAELDALLPAVPAADKPLRQDIAVLSDAVNARIKLLQEKPAAKPPKDSPKPDVAPGDAGGDEAPQETDVPATLVGDMISDDDINIIRVYEADTGPEGNKRITVKKETIDKLFEKYADEEEVPKGRDNQNRFRAIAEARQLDLIFAVQARELYPEVIIGDDPPALREYRSKIHRGYVLNYCATRECHGGEKAGSFYLFTKDGTTDRTVYTNYLILHQTETAQARMIDRDKPEKSLLMQYGMNRQSASYPHPDVPGWRQRLTGVDDPQFQMMVDWINTLQANPRYPINWTRPKMVSPDAPPDAETQPDPAAPAAEPAPQP